MPYTGAEVIDAARGLDPSFSPQNHPNRVCLEFLTRYEKRLSGKMLQRDRKSISSEITFDLPLATFADGVALEDGGDPIQHDRKHGFHLLNTNGDREPLPVVGFKDRITADRTLYGWLEQNTLFLAGIAQDWVGWTGIVFTYAPTATEVLLDVDMILPDNAWDVVVLAVGAEMGKRKPGLVERASIVEDWKEAEGDYLNLIEEKDGVTIGSVRRVYS